MKKWVVGGRAGKNEVTKSSVVSYIPRRVTTPSPAAGAGRDVGQAADMSETVHSQTMHQSCKFITGTILSLQLETSITSFIKVTVEIKSEINLVV